MKTRTITRIAALFLTPGLAAGLVLIEPQSASACYGCFAGSDGKTSNGLECQVAYGDRNHSWGYSSLGQICNYDSNDEVIVHCPLLRDKMTNRDGLSCASATVLHQGGAAYTGCGLADVRNYECVVQSKSSTGRYGWWEGWDSPAGDGGGAIGMNNDAASQTVHTDWRKQLRHSHNVTTNFHGGASYFLSCALPPVGSCGGSSCLSNLKWHES